MSYIGYRRFAYDDPHGEGEPIKVLPNEIPPELIVPARGVAPALENALLQAGVEIPRDWQVQTLLAAVCAGTATMIRQDLGLPIISPQKVNFYLYREFYHETGEKTGSAGYSLLGFKVRFEDNENFQGKIRVPGHNRSLMSCWGLPWYCSRKGEKNPRYGDMMNLHCASTDEFTPHGQRLVNFVAQTIKLA